jgi:redox-sensitive bicupin YhaK (pirin superfamily)
MRDERSVGMHGHRDMEIISYVMSGAIGHKDSIGNGASIPPGDVQRMSAGSGIMHSEFNHAQDSQTHFLQIWIEPNQRGIPPSYEQKTIAPASKRGALALIASHTPTGDAVKIHAHASLYAGLFDGEEKANLAIGSGHKAYIHLIRGQLQVNGQQLKAGDAMLLEGEHRIDVSGGLDAEVLVFDLFEN